MFLIEKLFKKSGKKVSSKLRVGGFIALVLGVVALNSNLLESCSDAARAPKEIQRLQTKSYLNAVAWSPDGTLLAAQGGFGRDVTLWETKNWTVVKEFTWRSGPYARNSLAFLPDNTLLTAAPTNTIPEDSRYKTLEMFSLVQWDPKAGKTLRYIPDLGYPPQGDLSIKVTETFTVSKDGQLIAGIAGRDVLLYEAKSARLVHRLKLPTQDGKVRDFSDSIAFSPNGQELAVGTISGMVRFFNLKDGQMVRSIESYSPEWHNCSALAYSPDGKLIAVGKYAGSDGHQINGVFTMRVPDDIAVTIWRVEDGVKIASIVNSTLKVRGKDDALVIRTMTWNPQDNTLVVGDDRSLHVWDMKGTTPELLLKRKMPQGTFSTAVSPQGMLATTDNNEVVVYK